MSDSWITTHWPTPKVTPGQSRHVFVKRDYHGRVPQPGDFIFFRESLVAKVNGKKVRTVTRHHLGHETRFDLPSGSGGIIGTATVDGILREQHPNDVVFNFGDLREWKVIPCRDFKSACLPMNKLRLLLDIKGLLFLKLWHIQYADLAGRLLQSLRPC